MDGAERYFKDFILPMCRHVGDSGQLIAVLQGQVEEWEKRTDRAARDALSALRMSLLLIEARTRNGVEAVQRAIDAAPMPADIDRLRAEGVI